MCPKSRYSRYFYGTRLYLQQIQRHHVCPTGNTCIFLMEQDFRECCEQSVGSNFSLLTSSTASDYFQILRDIIPLHIITSLDTIPNVFKRAGPENEYVCTNIFSYRSWVCIIMEKKLIVMNEIKKSKTNHFLLLWRIYPETSSTSCRVLQIWTWSPNIPGTAPSPLPKNSQNFTIHLSTGGLTNQLIIDYLAMIWIRLFRLDIRKKILQWGW